MNQLLHLVHRFKRGPHGAVVLAVLAMSGLACVALVVSVVYPPLRLPAAGATGIAVLAALNGVVVMANLIRAKLNDTHYALSLEAGLRQVGYEVVDLFTDGAAANPSLQLLHLKILRLCRPRRILELGSGQTTKLLSCYVQQDPTVFALTLEQDAAWMDRLRPHVVHSYLHAPLESLEVRCKGLDRRLSTMWYRDQPELATGQFDYVVVDGPDPGTRGTEHSDFSRCGILHYVPAILSTSFVIVFDDAERYGEIMTVGVLEEIFRACRIPYVRFEVHGIKTQLVLCSPDFAFLQSV